MYASALSNYAYPINTSDSDDHYRLFLLIVAVSRLAVMYALKARNKLHKREKEGLKEKERESQQRTRDSDAHHHHEPARRTPSTAKREAKVKRKGVAQFIVLIRLLYRSCNIMT